MMNAIVYTSNTGFTAQYAGLLGKKLNLPAYSLDTAKRELAAGAEILYLGWLMAGQVKGYKQAVIVVWLLTLLGAPFLLGVVAGCGTKSSGGAVFWKTLGRVSTRTLQSVPPTLHRLTLPSYRRILRQIACRWRRRRCRTQFSARPPAPL